MREAAHLFKCEGGIDGERRDLRAGRLLTLVGAGAACHGVGAATAALRHERVRIGRARPPRTAAVERGKATAAPPASVRIVGVVHPAMPASAASASPGS